MILELTSAKAYLRVAKSSGGIPSALSASSPGGTAGPCELASAYDAPLLRLRQPDLHLDAHANDEWLPKLLIRADIPSVVG